jgi:branched-chain amino acid aminotransferase
MTLAYWNGRLVPREEVSLDPDEGGFFRGDGLFETLRVDEGVARDIPAHLDRLEEGLKRIDLVLPEDRGDLELGIGAVAEKAPRPVARLRVMVTRGAPGAPPSWLVTAQPYVPPHEQLYREGVGVVIERELRLSSAGPLVGLKSLSYQLNGLALARAEAAGAFEALLLNESGRVVEGSRSNIIVVIGRVPVTPPLSDGCLPGTVRRRLIEAGMVTESSFGLEELAAAEEVLITSSLMGVMPVSRIEAKSIPVGPVAAGLRAALPSLQQAPAR